MYISPEIEKKTDLLSCVVQVEKVSVTCIPSVSSTTGGFITVRVSRQAHLANGGAYEREEP